MTVIRITQQTRVQITYELGQLGGISIDDPHHRVRDYAYYLIVP